MKIIRNIINMKACLNILENQIIMSKNQIRNIETYISRLEKQLQLYEEMEVNGICSTEGLDIEEVRIIIANMDKTDYRIYDNFRDLPRYIDYENICKEVIYIKKIYPGWKLFHLEKGVNGISNCLDSANTNIFYIYKYKDEYNNVFEKIVYV